MKKILIVLFVSMVSLGMSAQSGSAIYEKYADAEGVAAVHVSSNLFRLFHRLPSINVGGEDDLDLSPIVRSLTGLYVLTSENRKSSENMLKDVERYLRKGRFDELLEAKEKGRVIHVYTCGDEEIVESLVLVSRDSDEAAFICLDGEMPREELERAIAKAAED